MNKHLRWVRDKITFVFDNEKEFIDKFFRCYNVDDLLEFYMASERCKVILLLNSGETISDTIKTNDLLKWIKEVKVKVRV